jgi:hypothetical protein
MSFNVNDNDILHDVTVKLQVSTKSFDREHFGPRILQACIYVTTEQQSNRRRSRMVHHASLLEEAASQAPSTEPLCPAYRLICSDDML